MTQTENKSLNFLVESVSEALEMMAFMTPFPPEDEITVPTESVLVYMTFKGVIQGRIELLASRKLIEMMAGNIMGIDIADPQAHEKGVDAFKEVCNTTCGVFLPRLALEGSDAFEISVPEAKVYKSSGQWDTFINQEDVCVLELDGELLAIRLIVAS